MRTLLILCFIHVIIRWHTNFTHQAWGTVMSNYCVKKMSWCLTAMTLLYSVCWARAPYNLLNQNGVNITQCYSQMNGTNRTFNLDSWSLYNFSSIAMKHFFTLTTLLWVFSLTDIFLLWSGVLSSILVFILPCLCFHWVEPDFLVFNSLDTPTPVTPPPTLTSSCLAKRFPK